MSESRREYDRAITDADGLAVAVTVTGYDDRAEEFIDAVETALEEVYETHD